MLPMLQQAFSSGTGRPVPGMHGGASNVRQRYGAEAGNLALHGPALGGIYVGGGIAPKILPAIQSGAFMLAFRDKAPMAEMSRRF